MVAVRRGLRTAFSVASRAAGPSSAPVPRTRRGTSTGPNSRMPVNTDAPPATMGTVLSWIIAIPSRASPVTRRSAASASRARPVAVCTSTAACRAQRRQRAHPDHMPGRQPGRDHGDEQADGEPAQQPGHRQCGGGHRGGGCEGVDQGEQAVAESDADQRPGQRREHADGGRLAAYRAQHLPPGRADAAQQCEVAQALREQDGERVRDDQGRDEQRDAGEQQTHQRHDVHVVVEPGQAFRDVLVHRLHRHAFRERTHFPAHRHTAHVEGGLVAPLQVLRPGDVHRGLGPGGGRLHEADHFQVGRGGALADPDPVTDRDLPVVGVPHVHHRLARAFREAARDELLPAQLLRGGDRPHGRFAPQVAPERGQVDPAEPGCVLAEALDELDRG